MESPQRRFISSFEELLCLVVSREFLAILTIKRVSETKACFRCRVSDDSKVFIARSIRRTTLEKNRTVTFFYSGLTIVIPGYDPGSRYYKHSFSSLRNHWNLTSLRQLTDWE